MVSHTYKTFVHSICRTESTACPMMRKVVCPATSNFTSSWVGLPEVKLVWLRSLCGAGEVAMWGWWGCYVVRYEVIGSSCRCWLCLHESLWTWGARSVDPCHQWVLAARLVSGAICLLAMRFLAWPKLSLVVLRVFRSSSLVGLPFFPVTCLACFLLTVNVDSILKQNNKSTLPSLVFILQLYKFL